MILTMGIGSMTRQRVRADETSRGRVIAALIIIVKTRTGAVELARESWTLTRHDSKGLMQDKDWCSSVGIVLR